MDETDSKPDPRNTPLPKPKFRQLVREWRRQYVRPIWAMRMMARAVSSAIDLQDVLYFAGVIMLSIGAQQVCGDGFGLLAAGAMLIVPPLVSILGINQRRTK